MRLQLHNLRSIASADLELDDEKMTLICGPNGAGKSTLCTALAATLGSTALPIAPGRSRETRARNLVREGEKSAAVQLSSDSWSVRCAWPSEEVTTKGRPPICSEVALGTVRLGAIAAKERAALLNKTLGLEPSRDELAQALQAAGCADRLEEVWRDLQGGQDYDGLAKAYAEAATKAKGRWELATRQKRWGQRLAETWYPEGFENVDILTWNEADLERSLAQAQLALSEARVALGRTEAADVSRIPALETELATVETASQQAVLAWMQAPVPLSSDMTYHRSACPECGVEIAILPNQKLCKVADAPDYDAKAESDKRIAKERRLAEMNRIKEAEGAIKGELARLRQAAEKGAPTQAPDIAKAEATVDAARVALAAWRQASTAAAAQQTVVEALAIAQILGPEGIRQEKTKAALHRLNAELLTVVDGTGWPVMAIDENLEAVIATRNGGRPYGALSPSERWKVDALLALVLAQRNGDPLVILDGADIVTGIPARNDMITIAHRAGRAVVIAMAAGDRTKMPNLGSMGLGTTLWIEGGVVLGETRQEAA